MANSFFRGFLKNVYLRESCYQCKYKQLHRISDITMADYWGVQDVCPQMDDNKGTSAIFIHTPRAKKVLSCLSDNLLLKNQEIDDILACNSMMTQSVAMTSKRKRFFFYFSYLSFGMAKSAIDKDWIVKRLYGKFKRLLKNV